MSRTRALGVRRVVGVLGVMAALGVGACVRENGNSPKLGEGPNGFMEGRVEREGKVRRYALFVPRPMEALGDGWKYPVLVYLHNVGEGGNDLQRVIQAGLGPFVALRPGTADNSSKGIVPHQPDPREPIAAKPATVPSMREIRENWDNATRPHPWQIERVKNVGGESVEELLANLCDIDDSQFAGKWASGDPMTMLPHMMRLARVRRLFALGQAQPQEVVPQLAAHLADVHKTWEEALKAHQQLSEEVHRKSIMMEFPQPYHRQAKIATAATYLLAELGHVPSLPLLLDCYDQQLVWIDRYKPYPANQSPVPRATSLYAIHRLVQGVREESLDTPLKASRAEYLTWAQAQVSHRTDSKRLAWNALNDPAVANPAVMIDQRLQAAVEAEPKIVMASYPYRFLNGREIQIRTTSDLTPDGIEWEKRLLQVARPISKGLTK